MTAYYVSVLGSDTNDGLSTATPWQTVGKVTASSFAPGDTISFRGGDSFTGYLGINSSRAGTATQPVTYTSYGIGQATLTNTSTGVFVDTVGGVVFYNLKLNGGGNNASDGINCFKSTPGHSNSISIIACDITGFYYGISIGGSGGGGYSDVVIADCGIHANTADGIKMYGPAFNAAAPTYAHSNVTVQRCRSFNNLGDPSRTAFATGSGVSLGSVDGGVIEYSSAHNNGGSCQGVKGPVGIWAYDSNNVVIQNCVSYNNSTGNLSTDGDGFDLDLNCSNCVVQYCLAYGNFGAGIIVYGANNNTAHINNVVRYNICWGNVRSNVFYHSEIKVGGNVNNCLVYNNTLVALNNTATTNPPCVSINDVGAVNVAFRNNILYQFGIGDVISNPVVFTAANVLFQNNVYYRPQGLTISWGGTVYTTLTAWRAGVIGQETVSGASSGFSTDPLLNNPGTSPTVTDPADTSGVLNLRLQNSSPVISAGLNLLTLFGTDAGLTDYFKTVLSPPYSIGAYQFIPVVLSSGVFAPVTNTLFPNVTLDGQTWLFRVEGGPLPVDANGVEWILTKFDGWTGKPAPRTARTDRQGHPGSFRSAAHTGPRIMNLEVVATGPSPLALRNAEMAMAAVCSDGAKLYEMVVAESGFSRSVFVELDDAILSAPRLWNQTVFSLRLAAPDPRKHDGAWQTPVGNLGIAPMGGADCAGPGLVFTSYVDFGTPGVPSQVSVRNSGTGVAHPFFAVTGPLAANWQIIDQTNGTVITYTKALGPTDVVIINSDDFPTQGFPGHGVYLNTSNNQRSSLLTPGGWPSVMPGQTVAYILRSTTYSPAASMTVSLRSAWH